MRSAILVALAALLAFAAQDDGARKQALERDPRSLPAAPAGRWEGWTPSAPIPPEVDPALAEAATAYERGDMARALAGLQRVLELEPEYPPALHQMGVIYFRLQRYSDSAEAFERFQRVAPELVGQTRGLAHAYYSLGEYERARAQYARVLEAAPRDAEAQRGLALCHMRLGDSDRALELLGRVLEIEPAHADAATWVAQILYDEERLDAALEAAEHARDLDPFEPRPWFLLGQIQFELGRDEQGQAAHARFQQLERSAQDVRKLEHRLLYGPDQLALLGGLVEAHRSNGDVTRTRAALVRMVQVDPRDVRLRIHALDVLESMEDREGADVAAKALEQACGDAPEAWKRLELYYARTGDRMKRVQAGERFLRLSSRPEPR